VTHPEGHDQRVQRYIARYVRWQEAHQGQRLEAEWLDKELWDVWDRECDCANCGVIRRRVFGKAENIRKPK
jgi:hypothetical protein